MINKKLEESSEPVPQKVKTIPTEPPVCQLDELRGQEFIDDLNSARVVNDTQVEIINEQAQTVGDLNTQRDIVDRLLDASMDVFDVASECLKPMLMGYRGECNPASVAKDMLIGSKNRLGDLSSNLVIIGPSKSGKSSLCHSLVGVPILPSDVPSMITIKWTHVVGQRVPTCNLSDGLCELLEGWVKRIGSICMTGFQAEMPHQNTDGDDIEMALNNANKIIFYGRQLGTIHESELTPLCQAENFVTISLAFTALDDLSDEITETGSLSLVDLPCPDGNVFEQHDIKMLFRTTLRASHGVLLTVDVNKDEPSQIAHISDLIEELIEERVFRREDTWIVANAIDKLDDFHCYEGVATVCKRVKKEQYKHFKNIIMDEDHIIPTAAHLCLLALVGNHRIPTNVKTEKETAQLMKKLRYAPWFAQISHYYFGVNWIMHMRNIGFSKCPKMLEDVTLQGQVTAKLSKAVLQSAYENIFPRSVNCVMNDMKDVVEEFLQTIDTLQGGDDSNDMTGGSIDLAELKNVFYSFFADVKKKTTDQTAAYLPKKEDCHAFVESLAEKTRSTSWPAKFDAGRGATFEDYTTAPVEDFLKRASRELIRHWDQSFQACPDFCADIVTEAHLKWERSVDHYLRKMGANALSRKKILDSTADLRINCPKCVKPLGDDKWNELVKQLADQVPYRKQKSFLQRTRKCYELSPFNMTHFLEQIWEEWCLAAKLVIKQMILDVVKVNFDDMCNAIEKVNLRQDMNQLKEGVEFDFAFADELRSILPKLANFDVQGPSEDEIERCEELCAEVKRAVNRITLTGNFGNGLVSALLHGQQ